MLKRTRTKQRIDDRSNTNVNRLIMIGNLRILDLFVAVAVVRGKNIWQ